ncbi:hypothetical protein H0H93_004427 [Arthromyces matolae]|nr:hypothetical protein H0H93_004427 [Arthromyces matolae]
MDTSFLVATQLSSLFPLPPISIPLQTLRQGVPLPPTLDDSDPPPEQATYSSVLYTQATGTILLRVLHGGLIIEITSLSAEVPAIRLVFPSAVMQSPAMFLWETSEIHVLAVTNTGSLFRIVIPIGMGRELWEMQTTNIWNREYLLKNVEEVQGGLVYVQGIHSVLVGFRNGSLLRLENDYGSEDAYDDWTETVFQYSSFLSSLASFLPLSGGNPDALEIASIATHSWPTDIGHVWTLSRDRTLRLWKAKIGCIASKTLPPAFESGPASLHNGRHGILLDASPQKLLHVFTTPIHEEHIYVVVFIPTISSPSSSGTFHIFDTVSDQLYEFGKIEAPKETAHCHLQDFLVFDNAIWALWDRQGQSVVGKSVMNVATFHEGFSTNSWAMSCYASEPELTPAYLEEHLLSPGSMTEKFFEAIMRPGMFSALTLRTAIDQYTDVCLSMPGPKPAQLTAVYSTTSAQIAAVVGCTVALHRDPHTGAYQHANYWSALKRDWEGFIARCREIERSARRPLSLGVQDQDIVVVERERVGLVVKEDLAIYLRRILAIPNATIDGQYEIVAILWYLQNSLGPQVLQDLENRTMDIIRQETSFTIPEILKDQTDRFNFREELDPQVNQWIMGRLHGLENLDSAARTALDVIGGFDVDVKKEEDEVELLLPPPRSKWTQALVSAYISKTVDARYEIALVLITLLFFLSEDISDWDPSLLSEIFAVYRGIAMLRYVCRQPILATTDIPAPSHPAAADDFVSQMRNLNVSQSSQTHLLSTHSLIQRLVAQSDGNEVLPGDAHRYLDATGLLQSIAPGNATQYEATFCDNLRLLGLFGPCRELLSWLPRTPGVSYVQARLWLDIGRADDAALLFEKLAGSFGGHSFSVEDQEILLKVLPASELLDSQHFFYSHVSNLFKAASWSYHEVTFAQLAISITPPVVDTTSLWSTVIHGLIELGQFDDAYSSIMSTPYENLQKEFVCELTYRMCDDNAINKLMSFNFAGLADEVEEALAFKARNIDPRVQPSYSRILYTWFIRRGDYRNAAFAMYQRARRLCDLITDSGSFASLAEEQLEAYNLAINSLSLIDSNNAWIILPTPADQPYEPRKRRRLARQIPENKFTPGRFETDVIYIADMEYDYALLSAQIDIIKRDNSILSSPEFMLPPATIVLRLAHTNRFTLAMTTAKSLHVDMTDLFTHLTIQCLRLARNPNTTIQDTSDWLLNDDLTSWSGTFEERAWRYLRQSLQQYDSAETDYKYSKTTLETILGSEPTSSPPPWLIHALESNSCLAREALLNASSTWLPYTLIDQVLIAASDAATSIPKLSTLRSEISSRVKRMQNLSHTSSVGRIVS